MSTGDQYPKKNDNIWRGDHLTTPETDMLVGNHDNQIHALDRRTAKLERLTDAMLVDWESWRIRTDKRIEELESRMSGMCELQQIQEGKAMETRNIDDERFEKLELLSLKTDERIAALEKSRAEPEIVHCKRWADCTALLHRTAALEKLTCDKGNENANAIASATARVAANEARILALEERLQTVWIAPINALKERCDALEKIANSDDLATSFVKDAWRKDINERIAKIELPMTKESDASIKDHNENMCERFNDIEEKIDELQNTVISVRVLVGKRFESGIA